MYLNIFKILKFFLESSEVFSEYNLKNLIGSCINMPSFEIYLLFKKIIIIEINISSIKTVTIMISNFNINNRLKSIKCISIQLINILFINRICN